MHSTYEMNEENEEEEKRKRQNTELDMNALIHSLHINTLTSAYGSIESNVSAVYQYTCILRISTAKVCVCGQSSCVHVLIFSILINKHTQLAFLFNGISYFLFGV